MTAQRKLRLAILRKLIKLRQTANEAELSKRVAAQDFERRIELYRDSNQAHKAYLDELSRKTGQDHRQAFADFYVSDWTRKAQK